MPQISWRRAALAILLMTGAAGPALGQARPIQVVQAGELRFDIPAQEMARALTAFGRQSGWQLTYPSGLADGRRSQPLSGLHEPGEALTLLLEGSGIVWRQTGEDAAVLAAVEGEEDAVMLDPLRIEGAGAAGETVGYLATRSASATKTGTPILRTPQAVNVVTAQEIEERAATTVVDALQYTPGVISQYGDTDLRHDWFAVRGFVPGRYLDGLRLPFGARGYAQPKIEPYGLERVEVLKGPASVLYGQNEPGGLLNMVTKRPTRDPLREVFVRYGSHHHREAGFDLGGPIGEAGEFQYRLVGVGRLADSQVDHIDEDRIYIAPAFTWEPIEATRVTLLAQYQRINADGGGAPPALPALGTLLDGAPWGKLDRDTFIGEPNYDHFRNEQMAIGYELEQDVTDWFEVQQNFRIANVDTYTQRVQGFGIAGNNLQRYAWAFPAEATLMDLDSRGIFRFGTGPVDHTLTGGVEWLWESGVYNEHFQGLSVSPLDLTTLAYTGDAVKPPLTTQIIQDRYQLGFYAQEEATFGGLTVMLGGRYDTAEAKTNSKNILANTETGVHQEDDAFTGRAGLVYEFDLGLAPYASYSESFTPQAGTDRNGQPFEPTEGEQFELGLRYQPPGVNAMVTLSAYQLTQSNVLTPDPVNTSFRTQTGEVEIQGLELEGKASLMEGFDLSASYAYTESEITKANPNNAGVSIEGNRQPFVPRHQAALWADYELRDHLFKGWLDGLGLGGGVRYIGPSYGDSNNVYQVPGVTLFDAAIRYDFGAKVEQLQGLELAVNANNLLDKEYVSTCISATGCYYGAGRTVLATLKYKW